MVKQLKPFPQAPLPLPSTPRCEADTHPATEYAIQWRKRRYPDTGKPLQCSRPSVVEIDGKYYCRLHGGHIVLDKYLKGEIK